MNLIFYHGLTKEKWQQTIKQGYLLHNRNTSPVVYLATTKEEALCYGEVLLEVKYNPHKNPNENNYHKDCWQFRVYEPIELKNVKEVNL